MTDSDQHGTLDRREFLRAAGGLGAALGLGSVARVEASTRAGDEIMGMDALSLSAAIHARRVSCEEVMRACLGRIARLNPRFNAIVSLRPEDELLVEARACDAELAAGRSRGWMHGFPHAVKDLADVKGLPTSLGSPISRGAVAAADSVFVERLRAAGAIFIGKTNTPEFGLGSQTYNPVFGITRNAWDPSRTAGGSSGGACVALALRLVPVADGSDMMGSLRNPAGWNNVIGFRPSQGRIPDESPSWYDQLGTNGPMARTVPEAARLLATMAGYDPRDPMSLGEDPAVFAGSLAIDTRGLRVGWLGDLDGYLPMEPGVIPLCEQALGTVSVLGGSVEPLKPPFPPERLWQAWRVLRHWSVGTWGAPLYRDARLRAQ
ncbi:MAG: amidase, partial [Gammaproteobacteria bacterium]